MGPSIGRWNWILPIFLAAFAVAQTPVPPAPPIKYGEPVTTDITPVQTVSYRSTDTDLHALLIAPKLAAKANCPAIIIVHDIFGMTPFIKQQAETLARQGYTVLIPNLYSRLDKSDQQFDANAAWAAYDKTPDQQVVHDLSSSIEYLVGKGAEGKPTAGQPLGIVGYDMGGIYAMMMAGADLRVSAAVNYYGRILYANTSHARPASPVESLFNLRAPLLSFYGSIDPQIPDTQIKALQSRLANNPNNTFYEIVRYPNVGHGFVVPTRQGYNEQAATQSAEKTKLFLARFLRAKPPADEE